MYQTDASNTHDTKRRAEAEKPLDGDLILNIKLILLERAVVPYIHNYHEDTRKGNGDPSSFQELDEGS